EFLIRGDRTIAWLPRPYDDQHGVAYDVNLAWNPGDLASSHKVYFGTDWVDVNDMTEPCATPSIGNEEYNPGPLQPDTTFFWRVDEVNDSNLHVWTGRVWQFSTSDFVFLDDFEHYYGGGDTAIGGTWYQGPTMGSQVSLAKVPQYPVYGGVQGMRYKYWTDKTEEFPFVQQFDYAEAYLPLDEIDGFTNWDGFGLRLLAISFSGKPDNDTTEYEQMYIGLQDTDGNYAEMRYGDRADEDMNDLKVDEWQTWYVPFVWFTDGNAAVANGIDFSSIDNVYLGFGDRRDPEAAGKGEVFFDDLLVSMPTCVPEKLKPPYDFSNNCIVDITDVGIMGGDWLTHDVNFADHLGIQVQEPCDANLVGHWKLDEGEGAFAYDSSIYDNNGIVETNDVNVFWVVGHDGNALEFVDGGRVRVDHTPELTPMHQVSVSAWIKYSDKQDNARVVTKGSADSNETYQLEVDGEDVLAFYIRDGNDDDPCGHVDYKVQSDIVIRRDEWTHVAGTFDANTIKCYINGELVAESDDPNIPAIPYLCQDTNDLGIGNRPDANEVRYNEDAFKGTIDDVRIYDYGLSQAEVGWLASEGTGYVPLTSPYNIYSGEFQEAVNLKDFAELLNYWGDEQLWPAEP
ncbi:MAG: LamG domain-containing protein, partial [Planctomycetota bacterium]